MSNARETELLGKLELLERRIEQLEMQNDSLRAGVDGSRLKVNQSPNVRGPVSYLANFISAASFPLVAGLFRLVYKKIYRLRK